QPSRTRFSAAGMPSARAARARSDARRSGSCRKPFQAISASAIAWRAAGMSSASPIFVTQNRSSLRVWSSRYSVLSRSSSALIEVIARLYATAATPAIRPSRVSRLSRPRRLARGLRSGRRAGEDTTEHVAETHRGSHSPELHRIDLPVDLDEHGIARVEDHERHADHLLAFHPRVHAHPLSSDRDTRCASRRAATPSAVPRRVRAANNAGTPPDSRLPPRRDLEQQER